MTVQHPAPFYISKKEVFEMILDKNKFRDPKIVLKRLKELGVLVSDKDRYISKFTVAKDGENILVRGYRLYVPNDETPINDEGVTTDGQKNDSAPSPKRL